MIFKSFLAEITSFTEKKFKIIYQKEKKKKRKNKLK